MVQPTAADLARAIRCGERSPVDAVEACLDRIVKSDCNAFVTVLPDEARERARAAERSLADGADLGPLGGVPVALKDAYAYKSGTRNTFGSPAMAEFVPDRSAPLVERLEAAGAIVVGKTNTPEFAAKGVTDNGLVGRTRNPFEPARTAGGSSGGSAAAVAAGLVPLAQGSDHAGSIRIPAGACGVVGIAPTPGRVPQAFRPDAYKYDLPHVSSGPLTRTVEDAALALEVMSGPHPEEPTAIPGDPGFLDALNRPVDGLRVAYTPTFAGAPVDPRVRAVVDDAVTALETAGTTVERAAPDFEAWDEAHDAIMMGLEVLFATFAENLRERHGIDLLARRDQVDPHVVDRIETGRKRGAVAYKRANVARSDLFRAVQALFGDYDLLVTPTLSVPAFDAAEGSPETIDGRPVERTLGWFQTWPFNLTGHPAASVPAGMVEGLPVGAQIVAPRFADSAVIAAAATLEEHRPWAGTYPG
jgi:Asp-tRNA(Asn)/Glu-tRNA(Gln) amidotransferase A subunit family amidase